MNSRMNHNNLLQTLHEYEQKVLLVLDSCNTLTEIAKKSHLQEIEAMRGLQWLENKGIVKLSEETKDLILLDKNGTEYLNKGLPEKRFLKSLKKDTPISEILEKAN